MLNTAWYTTFALPCLALPCLALPCLALPGVGACGHTIMVLMLLLCGYYCFVFVAEVRRSKHVGERSVFPLVCMWANSSLW